jgi:hypothetical protein
VRQVHIRARGRQRIDRPVPPESRLDDDLRDLPSPPDHLDQPVGIVHDLNVLSTSPPAVVRTITDRRR